MRLSPSCQSLPLTCHPGFPWPAGKTTEPGWQDEFAGLDLCNVWRDYGPFLCYIPLRPACVSGGITVKVTCKTCLILARIPTLRGRKVSSIPPGQTPVRQWPGQTCLILESLLSEEGRSLPFHQVKHKWPANLSTWLIDFWDTGTPNKLYAFIKCHDHSLGNITIT